MSILSAWVEAAGGNQSMVSPSAMPIAEAIDADDDHLTRTRRSRRRDLLLAPSRRILCDRRGRAHAECGRAGRTARRSGRRPGAEDARGPPARGGRARPLAATARRAPARRGGLR